MLDTNTTLDLINLAEESNEVGQVIMKILRFGLHDKHPKNGNIENVKLLEKEIGHLMYWVNELSINRVINIENVHQAQYDKIESAEEWRDYALKLREDKKKDSGA